ncbi:MAG TPA: hypothetical protein VGI48_10200 [Caldimonas sp.]
MALRQPNERQHDYRNKNGGSLEGCLRQVVAPRGRHFGILWVGVSDEAEVDREVIDVLGWLVARMRESDMVNWVALGGFFVVVGIGTAWARRPITHTG